MTIALLPFQSIAHVAIDELNATGETDSYGNQLSTIDISSLLINEINPKLKREINFEDAYNNLKVRYPELNQEALDQKFQRIVDDLIENGVVIESENIKMAGVTASILNET